MVRFTPNEMLAINGIAGNKEIFGLPFHFDTEDDEMLMKKTLASLHDKGILIDNKLSDAGQMMALLFETYHNANTHVFLNRSRMALDNDDIIAFVKEEEEICVVRKHKVKAMEDIVMNNIFLRNEQQKSFFIPQPIFCSKEKWINEEIDQYPNYILIQKYSNRTLVQNKCLAWNEEEGICYDYLSETMKEMGSRDLRIVLMEAFEIEVERRYVN